MVFIESVFSYCRFVGLDQSNSFLYCCQYNIGVKKKPREGEMGGACGTFGKKRNVYRFFDGET